MPDRPSTPRRQRCAWCCEAGQWPDLCSEDRTAAQDWACGEIIASQCEHIGDHRRCRPETCAFSAQWHPVIIATGVEAARAAGELFAVVSIVTGDPVVVGTGSHLGRVKSLIKTPEIRRAGYEPADQYSKGTLVHTVSVTGWIF